MLLFFLVPASLGLFFLVFRFLITSFYHLLLVLFALSLLKNEWTYLQLIPIDIPELPLACYSHPRLCSTLEFPSWPQSCSRQKVSTADFLLHFIIVTIKHPQGVYKSLSRSFFFFPSSPLPCLSVLHLSNTPSL